MLEFYPCFPINDQLDQTNYYLFNKGFDDVQLDYIMELLKNYDVNKGLVPEEGKTEWIYELIMEYAMVANFNLWKFDINHFKDSIQYLEYQLDEYNDWHIDLGSYPYSTRKITIIIDLSDPNEYEGGELYIKTGSGEQTLIKSKGSVILFPSYLMYKITPVTKGTRKLLVMWVGGSVFR